MKWVDPSDPDRGLMFDGRIAEDFKLSSGTFVSVGPLRARIIAAGAPFVQDVVLAGPDRDEVAMLVFPRLDECRRLARLGADAPAADVVAAPAVREFFQALTDRMWAEGTGSASRIARAHLLADPPSIDRGEMTDKGSINQRAVLTHRAALVEAVYGAAPGGRGETDVIVAREDIDRRAAPGDHVRRATCIQRSTGIRKQAMNNTSTQGDKA